MFASISDLSVENRGARSRSALRLLTRRARHERPRVSPAVIEEEASTLLYGERSGMVSASPVGPPLAEERTPEGED